MDVLLDTHVFLEWQAGDIKRGSLFYDAIRAPENSVVVSVTTIWESTIKRNSGKLSFNYNAKAAVFKNGFELLTINADHAERAAALPLHHRDPFDRMLIGQALEEGLILVTSDSKIALYNVPQLREK